MRIIKSIVCAIGLAFCLTACKDDDTVISAPAPDATGTWVDERDGSEYQWVRYGKLEWTKQNLCFKPSDGKTLPDMSAIAPGKYDDGIATKYYDTFGLLYDHEAAISAVPEGWRLPTAADWDDLETRTGGDILNAIGLQLGGYYLDDEYFQQIHPNVDHYAYVYGLYWTSTTDTAKTGDAYAFYRKLTFNRIGSEIDSMDKINYMNVRLVRDTK